MIFIIGCFEVVFFLFLYVDDNLLLNRNLNADEFPHSVLEFKFIQDVIKGLCVAFF